MELTEFVILTFALSFCIFAIQLYVYTQKTVHTAVQRVYTRAKHVAFTWFCGLCIFACYIFLLCVGLFPLADSKAPKNPKDYEQSESMAFFRRNIWLYERLHGIKWIERRKAELTRNKPMINEWGNLAGRILGNKYVVVESSFMQVKTHVFTYTTKGQYPINGVKHLSYKSHPINVVFVKGDIGSDSITFKVESQRNHGINSTFVFYT